MSLVKDYTPLDEFENLQPGEYRLSVSIDESAGGEIEGFLAEGENGTAYENYYYVQRITEEIPQMIPIDISVDVPTKDGFVKVVFTDGFVRYLGITSPLSVQTYAGQVVIRTEKFHTIKYLNELIVSDYQKYIDGNGGIISQIEVLQDGELGYVNNAGRKGLISELHPNNWSHISITWWVDGKPVGVVVDNIVSDLMGWGRIVSYDLTYDGQLTVYDFVGNQHSCSITELINTVSVGPLPLNSETVTGLSFDAEAGAMIYCREDGTTVRVPLDDVIRSENNEGDENNVRAWTTLEVSLMLALAVVLGMGLSQLIQLIAANW